MSEKAVLSRQYATAWRMASYHLQNLTDEECLWRPSGAGLHVQRGIDGRWQADWPSGEDYDIGPPSIAWITWHVDFWWSNVLHVAAGRSALAHEDFEWVGSADKVRARLQDLHGRWTAWTESLSDSDFRADQMTRWPFTNRPYADVVAWVNIELTKNAAELGYARFLYAVAKR